MQLMRAHAFLADAREIDRPQCLVRRNMRRTRKQFQPSGELLAAIRAFAKADSGLGKIVMLAAHRATMRTDRAAPRPRSTAPKPRRWSRLTATDAQASPEGLRSGRPQGFCLNHLLRLAPFVKRVACGIGRTDGANHPHRRPGRRRERTDRRVDWQAKRRALRDALSPGDTPRSRGPRSREASSPNAEGSGTPP